MEKRFSRNHRQQNLAGGVRECCLAAGGERFDMIARLETVRRFAQDNLQIAQESAEAICFNEGRKALKYGRHARKPHLRYPSF